MNATVTKLSSNKVKIDFIVDADRFEHGLQAAYRKVGARLNIPGFRKGKAPRRVIEMQYGASVFYEDALDHIFPEVYAEAVKQHALSPVDQPEFLPGHIAAGEEVTFSVEVYVKPDVILGKYLGVEAHRHLDAVTDDDVAAEIERARERAATYVDVTDRPVKLDDIITLDYEGSVDGVPFEGGAASDQKLTIGSGSFIPGFEEGLVGAEIGVELSIPVSFPEDYHAEALAGKPAVFRATVKSIQQKDLPELDDEFAKDVSECETLAAYRDKVRQDLTTRAEARADADFEHHVLEEVLEGVEVDIPDRMIEDRIDDMVRDTEMRMRYQGLSLEQYLGYVGQTVEQMRDSMRPRAENDVKLQLTIEAVADAENVTPTDEEIDKEIKEYVDRSRGDFEKFKAGMTDDDRAYFAKMARMQKTVELLKGAAVVCDHDHDHGDHDHGEDEGE